MSPTSGARARSAPTELAVISAGAARGLFEASRARLSRDAAVTFTGSFGAVGAMQALLLGGQACDLFVSTQAMLESLARDGHVLAHTIAPLGRVGTGIAVRRGEPWPDVSDATRLRANLLACSGLWVPDTQQSTAGRHVAAMLDALGIGAQMASRLREHEHGAAAMTALAASDAALAIGCTQVSEILAVPGVTLVAALPAAFALATQYSAAVCARAARPEAALRAIAVLAGPPSAAVRQRAGFEPPAPAA